MKNIRRQLPLLSDLQYHLECARTEYDAARAAHEASGGAEETLLRLRKAGVEHGKLDLALRCKQYRKGGSK